MDGWEAAMPGVHVGGKPHRCLCRRPAAHRASCTPAAHPTSWYKNPHESSSFHPVQANDLVYRGQGIAWGIFPSTPPPTSPPFMKCPCSLRSFPEPQGTHPLLLVGCGVRWGPYRVAGGAWETGEEREGV
jgi:hypothetical protein